LPPTDLHEAFYVAFYNLENATDTINDPHTDDDEFTPQGDMRWNTERYQRKMSNLGRVLRALNGDTAGTQTTVAGLSTGRDPNREATPLALLGLCEVENQEVIREMLQAAGLAGSHGFVHFNSRYHRGVDVALVYDARMFTVLEAVPHPVIPNPAEPEKYSRDVLEVRLQVRGKRDQLTVLVNHWPSRRNDEEQRLRTARQVRGIVDSLQQAQPEASIVLMGDLNDEPANRSVREVLKARSSREGLRPTDLYNAFAALDSTGDGTHKHFEEWNLLDQIILSGNLVPEPGGTDPACGLVFSVGSAQIFRPDFMQDTHPRFRGNPRRTFAGDNYLGGYSDHFPVRIRMRYR
jgi:endonuclease/exonuclease/phosphatase family metal-dependent hydrolase